MYNLGSAIIGLFIMGVVFGATVAAAAILALPWLFALVKPTLRSLVG